MNNEQWRKYAMSRGRVTNTRTGQVGNLVDWMSGQFCKAFVGYGPRVGTYQPANFETWLKSDTQPESNAVPVGGAK